MKVLPVAFDSMGVRSEATLLIAGKEKISFDPGVALAPKRFGLPPSKPELEALKLAKELIMELAETSRIVVVTHYHYDHHPYPDDEEMYRRCFKGKTVLCKHISKEINQSGRKRGKVFYEKVTSLAKEVVFADGEEFEFGKAKLVFSPAVWHGDVGSKVGKVIMASVSYGKLKFLFGSDAQSLADPDAKEWFIRQRPQLAVVDGYPTLFLGWKFGKESFENAKKSVIEAFNKTQVKEVILDHHVVREGAYKERLADIFESCKRTQIMTAAEYLGLPNLFLEWKRRELHKNPAEADVKEYYAKLRTLLIKRIKT